MSRRIDPYIEMIQRRTAKTGKRRWRFRPSKKLSELTEETNIEDEFGQRKSNIG